MNKKKLIVIGSYPNTPKKEEVLKLEIESLKGLGFDFMLVSHYPVSSEIQNMVDYYIYDKNQTLTPLEKTTYYWFQTDIFILRVNNSRHALPICQNMYNAFKMAEIKEYDFVFFCENDNIFSNDDAIKLSNLVNDAVLEKKSGIFFKPYNYQDNHSKVYETQMFGIQPKRFNELFKLPLTGDEFFENPDYSISLELGFYNSLKEFEDEFLIIDQHSYNYFTNSQINIFRMEHFIVDLLFNSSNEFEPVLFFQNRNNGDIKECRIVIKLDDIVKTDMVVQTGIWSYQVFNYTNQKLRIEVFMDNTLEIIRDYILDDVLKNKIKENGIIDFY
jgi:hypothetical protein